MTALIVLLVLIAIVAILVMGYNRLVALRANCDQAFADIDVQLKQRRDLVPNLVETVRGYATHEKETLDAVIQARNAAAHAGGGIAATAQAEGVLGAALGRLVALSEAYPDLKANTNFQQLMSELGDIENKIAAARRFLNNAVAEYNTALQQFPSVLYAAPMGFTHRPYFDVGEEERAALQPAPEVKF